MYLRQVVPLIFKVSLVGTLFFSCIQSCTSTKEKYLFTVENKDDFFYQPAPVYWDESVLWSINER
jgi:hypothetical protein